jgi:hypothetical protein
MTNASALDALESAHKRQRNMVFLTLLPWLGLVVFLLIIAFSGASHDVAPILENQFLFLLAAVIPCFFAVRNFQKFLSSRKILVEYRSAKEQLFFASRSLRIKDVQEVIRKVETMAKSNNLIEGLRELKVPDMHVKAGKLRQKELHLNLEKECAEFFRDVDSRFVMLKNELPIFKARANIVGSIKFIEARRTELKTQWEVAYENFSWWNKLKYGGGPDFSNLDQMSTDLRIMRLRLEKKHKNDFEVLEKHVAFLKKKTLKRMQRSQSLAEEYIRDHAGASGIDSDILKKSLLFSAMSIPVSIWSDLDRASDVFDALRGVHRQFSGMSDTEIWWEAIALPTQNLAGLAALTKGAYFEQLVAADTGGELFEHFNNPSTDVVIDGVAFQLKATDSASYVNSVAEGIPVIATSEVAFSTGVIDSGHTNEELTTAVDLALGNTVVEFGDTTVDTILAGVGGLGFFATLEGMNHAMRKHENGGDAVESLFEGAGVAIEGTARAFVGAAEMGYRMLSSRPSRFFGRVLVKGLVKLDDKMMADVAKK